MSVEYQSFICVNCGHPVNELYRRYGPSVLKLTNCDKCKMISDKYVEYDPVILMIDIVLLSKEAYRHVLTNTKFKVFWKLVIAILFMDTYNIWSSELMLKSNHCPYNSSSTTDTIVHLTSNIWSLHSLNWWLNLKSLYSHVDIEACERMLADSKTPEETFLAEEGFYKAFLRIFLGSTVFTLVVSILMSIYSYCLSTIKKVDFTMLCKAVTLGSLGMFFSLPIIIWGKNPEYSIHLTLVLAYTLFGLVNVISVSYNIKKYGAAVVILTAYTMKCFTLEYTHSLVNNIISLTVELP